ncbi:MAG TPA: ATP-binding protein [Holophagaceae bacterium]|nr:ATP-binding protein [Holophagaceae bacterium]
MAPPAPAQVAPAFHQLSLREGLPQSQVTALHRDRRGFLWVGTNAGGVARLGANGFQAFGAAQGLMARQVSSIWEDSDGTMIVASRDEGLSAIRGNRVRNFPTQEGLGPIGCFDLGPAPGGGVAAGTVKGLWIVRAGELTRVPLPAPMDDQPIFALALDGRERLWILGRTAMGTWDGKTFESRNPPPGRRTEDVLNLRRDAKGQMHLLYPDAVYRAERGGWQADALPPQAKGVRLTNLAFRSGGGRILSLGDDGLLIEAPDGGSHQYVPGKGLPHDKVNLALEDPHGVIWVGTDGSGLVALARPNLGSLSLDLQRFGTTLGAIMSILELGPDHLLLAGSQGVYEVRADKVVGHWARKEGLPATSTWSLVEDRAGGAFVGTDVGLGRWRNGRVEALSGSPDLRRSGITSLTWHGGHLFGGSERGLFELDRQGKLLGHHRVPSNLGSAPIGAVLSFQGQLLVGLSRGLARFEGGTFTPIHTGSPLTGQVISALAADSQGRLWAGSSRGLWVLDHGQWKAAGFQQGLPDDAISFITDLGAEGVAIGHGRGVTLLREGRRIHLTEAVGLLSNETNSGAAHLDRHNRLWIGMVGGVSVLDLDSPLPPEVLPAPELVEASWGEGYATGQEPIVVPPGATSLEVALDVPHGALPLRPRLQVRLAGLEADYQELPGDGHTQFRGLSPGTYQLQARSSLDGLTWVDAAPIPLRITPAWHQRWIARALFGIVLLGALVGVFVLRYNALAREARALEAAVEDRTLAIARQNRALEQAHDQIRRTLESRVRLLDTLAHDLRSPLTSIMLAVDRVRDGVPEESGLQGPLGVLDHESHRIEGLLRGLLNQRRSEAMLESLQLEYTTPRELLGGLEGVLRIKAEARDLVLLFEPDEASAFQPLRVDPGALQQALFNLFENSLKFTPAGGRVGVRTALDTARGEWRLTVWDTGRGIPPESVEAILQPFQQASSLDSASGWGLGLSIVRSLLEAQGGRLEVESRLGRGSAFTLVLPLPTEDL